MKKSITKNYLYNLLYQILVLIVPLITTPYISRVLGAENIGIYSYTLSISAYFILFGTLGIALYGQREIAFHQKDRLRYSKIFWEIIVLRIITMTISIIIFYFTFVSSNNSYHVYYKILILELLGNMVDISWFFQGLEEFKKTITRNMMVKVISVCCIFIFVKSRNDLLIYFMIYALSLLVGNMSLWMYLPKFLEKIKIRELKIVRHLKATILLFIPQIAVQIYTLLDRTMIGTIVVDKQEVGFYEQSQKIVKILLTIITSLGTVMMPRIASTFANGDREKVTNYMEKSFNIVFLLAFPLIIGICVIADAFVPIFFGEGYERVSILIKVMSPIILLIGMSNVLGTQYLLPTKRQREYTLSVVGGAMINLMMNSMLIPRYGAVGAAIGTILAEMTVTGIQMKYTKKDFCWKNIVSISKKYVTSSLIMLIICEIVKNATSNMQSSIILQIIIGIVSYGTSLILLKDQFTLNIINEISKKIWKKELIKITDK